MTIKKFRETAVESKYKDWLKEQSIELHYFGVDEPIVKTGITDIYRFFVSNSKKWDSYQDSLPKKLDYVRNHFEKCVTKLVDFISKVDQKNENNRDREWTQVRNFIKKHQQGSEYKIFTPELPQVSFLLQVYEDFQESFNGAYDYLILGRIDREQLSSSSAKSDYMRGILLAYEFELQDHTELLQRRNNEKISLGKLRSNFEDYLSEVETSTSSYLRETKEKFDAHSEQIVETKNEKERLFDEWFGNSKQSFDTFDQESHNRVKELEDLYIQKLHFSAPVQYWIDRASDMRDDGKKWAIWFGLSIFVAAASLFILLWIVPDEMTAALFNGEPAAIKWTLLFITFISFLAYGVRTFAKLTFSSFHLARDAEEREQLTHVYLALKKDGNVEKEDRQIILQSLFSRAETGLLKDDSSPTMPGTFLEKLSGMK
jgi:hypothetical protein